MSKLRWFTTLFAFSMLGACSQHARKPPPPSPLNPDVGDRANADIQRASDHYVATAPKKKDYLQAGLNAKMSELQGDPNDPVPPYLGLLESAPAFTATGLDALSPIAVSTIKAKLRVTLHREPTSDDVLSAIASEDQARMSLGDMLDMRRADIAAIYADIASLNKQGKTNQVIQRRKDLQKLRADVLAAWQQQQGIIVPKSDAPGTALTPNQIIDGDRKLLVDYLNNGVTQSR